MGLFSFLCVLLGMGAGNHAVLELEVFAEPFADQDVALVLRQVVFAGGLEVQVSVEALVGEFSGRSAKDIVQSVISVRDATQARKIDWLKLDWASGPLKALLLPSRSKMRFSRPMKRTFWPATGMAMV